MRTLGCYIGPSGYFGQGNYNWVRTGLFSCFPWGVAARVFLVPRQFLPNTPPLALGDNSQLQCPGVDWVKSVTLHTWVGYSPDEKSIVYLGTYCQAKIASLVALKYLLALSYLP